MMYPDVPDAPSGVTDPTTRYPSEDFPKQEQDQPGQTEKTEPRPHHGEKSYVVMESGDDVVPELNDMAAMEDQQRQ